MKTLIDPHLLVICSEIAEIDVEEFWTRIVSISSNTNSVIGLNTFSWVVDNLNESGYPSDQFHFGPENVRRESDTAMRRILSKVPEGSCEPQVVQFTPNYMASDDGRKILALDVTSHTDILDAVVSDGKHWTEIAKTLDFEIGHAELLLDISQVPQKLIAEKLKKLFENRRIHILGGKKTAAALARIHETLGVSPNEVNWIEAEKGKPPRALDKTWGALDPARDLTLCITGRVGHQTWSSGKIASHNCGIDMIELQSQGRIVEALIEASRRFPQRS